MTYTIVSEYPKIDLKSWSTFVSDHPDGNIFQKPEMYQLLKATHKFEPIILIVYDNNENICGLIVAVVQREFENILGFFTTRTIIWGGPLIDCDDTREKAKLVDLLLKSLIRRVNNKSIYIQFRNLFDLSDLFPQFRLNGFAYHDHLNFIVNTSEEKGVRSRISKSKITQVNKSLENGAKIIEPNKVQDVISFYKILKTLYKTKVKKPLPSRSFFVKFYEKTKLESIGVYLLIQYQGKIIGGTMCPITRDKAIYELYICGLDKKFKGIYPSVLATWAPIEYALNNGLKFFDFMGAGNPDEQYGVRKFKARFGGELVNYGRFERVNHKSLYKLGKLGINLLNIL